MTGPGLYVNHCLLFYPLTMPKCSRFFAITRQRFSVITELNMNTKILGEFYLYQGVISYQGKLDELFELVNFEAIHCYVFLSKIFPFLTGNTWYSWTPG